MALLGLLLILFLVKLVPSGRSLSEEGLHVGVLAQVAVLLPQVLVHGDSQCTITKKCSKEVSKKRFHIKAVYWKVSASKAEQVPVSHPEQE